MITNNNGTDCAFCTYESIIHFLMKTYEIPEKSETFVKTQKEVINILEKENIECKENELKIAIIVFAIIESVQSNNNLNNSLNLLGTTLVENNITTALQLEHFLSNDEEDFTIFKQIIKSRSLQRLGTCKLNATLTQKGKTVTVEQNGSKVKITD